MPSQQGSELVSRLARAVDDTVRGPLNRSELERIEIAFTELVNRFERGTAHPSSNEHLVWNSMALKPALTVHRENDGTEYKVSDVLLIRTDNICGPAQLVEKGGTGLPMDQRPLHWRTVGCIGGRITYLEMVQVRAWAKLPEVRRAGLSNWDAYALRGRAPSPIPPANTDRPIQFFRYEPMTPQAAQQPGETVEIGRVDFSQVEDRAVAQSAGTYGVVAPDPETGCVPSQEEYRVPRPIDFSEIRIGQYADYYPPPAVEPAPITAQQIRDAVSSLREAAPRVQEFYQALTENQLPR